MAKADMILCNLAEELKSQIERSPTNHSPKTSLIREYHLFQCADINKTTKFPFACLLATRGPDSVTFTCTLYSLVWSLFFTLINKYLEPIYRGSNAFFLTGNLKKEKKPKEPAQDTGPAEIINKTKPTNHHQTNKHKTKKRKDC